MIQAPVYFQSFECRFVSTEIFIFSSSCLFNTWLIAVINRVISLRNTWWIITYQHSSWLLVNKLWVIVISFYTFFWNSMPIGTYSLTFHVDIVIYMFYSWRLLLFIIREKWFVLYSSKIFKKGIKLRKGKGLFMYKGIF